MKFRTCMASLLALTLSVASLAAQSALAVADAGPFIGKWTINVDSPQGPFEQMLALTDKGGKVAGELTSPIAPGPTAIDDITKDGDALVLKFAGDFQGNAFTAAIRLVPDGANKANVVFDVMDGQFVMNGTATKQ
jgi:hypothetical protein